MLLVGLNHENSYEVLFASYLILQDTSPHLLPSPRFALEIDPREGPNAEPNSVILSRTTERHKQIPRLLLYLIEHLPVEYGGSNLELDTALRASLNSTIL